MKIKIIFKNILSILISFVLLFCFCTEINAKNVDFNIEQESLKNDILILSVNINSNTKINAGQSIIDLNDNLELISINKNNSIFDMWIKYPKYNKKNNSISFAGGIIGGFTGEGNLFDIKLKIKNTKEDITFKFNNSLILAANGKGTDLLKQKSFYKTVFIKSKISMK